MVFPPACKKLKPSPKPEARVLPDDIVVSVNAMKVKQLQAALRSRRRNATGRKRELRERLLTVLKEEHFGEQQGDNAVEEADDGNDIVDEEQQSEPAAVAAAPVQQVQRHSVVMVDLVEETDSMRLSEANGMKISLGGVGVVSSPRASMGRSVPVAVAGKEMDSDVEMPDAALSPKVPSEKKEVKRSRSPIQRVQNGVHSAVKMVLSGKKSPRSPKKSPHIAAESNRPASTQKVESELKAEEAMPLNSIQTTKQSSGDKSSSSSKLGVPVVGSSSSGNSALKSKVLQQKNEARMAKNEARMAKLKEMREKVSPLRACLRKLLDLPYARSS